MSNSGYVKGECHACGGPLEFPAAGAGETVSCPHCGQPTVLAAGRPAMPATGGGRRPWGWPTVAVVLAALAAGYFLAVKPGPPGAATAPPAAPRPATNPAPPAAVVPAPPAYDVETNDFGISTLTLEKTPGSSLVYVTGSVRNLSDHQRFGVKVDYALFDAHDRLIGHATDYQSLLEPQGDWDFKAMVMESRAVAARFNGITEQ